MMASPYGEVLLKLPAHTQQRAMEFNGEVIET